MADVHVLLHVSMVPRFKKKKRFMPHCVYVCYVMPHCRIFYSCGDVTFCRCFKLWPIHDADSRRGEGYNGGSHLHGTYYYRPSTYMCRDYPFSQFKAVLIVAELPTL